MRLEIRDSHLCAGGRVLEPVRPERAAAVLEGRGFRPNVARAIAHGDLASPTGARRVARLAGLIAVETGDARARGLVR